MPSEGIVDGCWLQDFLEIYESAGLDIHKRPLGPLLPAPHHDGWLSRPLTSEEVGSWLRLLLGLDKATNVRSHSMKGTICSWAAKAGFDKETRSALSHHVTALAGSEIIYSRDLQTRPIRKLQKLLKEVKTGGFRPDDPRADRERRSQLASELDKGAGADVEAPTNAVKRIQVKQEEDFQFPPKNVLESEHVADLVFDLVSSSDSDADSTITASSSDSDANSSDAELAAPVPTTKAGVQLYMNPKSKVVHGLKPGVGLFFCGVLCTSYYKEVAEDGSEELSKCLRCFPANKARARSLGNLGEAIVGVAQRHKAKKLRSE